MNKFEIRLVDVGFEATMATYQVDIGHYKVTVNVLNCPGKARKTERYAIGSGGFGQVVPQTVTNVKFVAKVMKKKLLYKKGEISEFEEMVKEVAFCKLCALFKIGPDVETSIPYDLLVYENAVQFHMEECSNVSGCVNL